MSKCKNKREPILTTLFFRIPGKNQINRHALGNSLSKSPRENSWAWNIKPRNEVSCSEQKKCQLLKQLSSALPRN